MIEAQKKRVSLSKLCWFGLLSRTLFLFEAQMTVIWGKFLEVTWALSFLDIFSTFFYCSVIDNFLPTNKKMMSQWIFEHGNVTLYWVIATVCGVSGYLSLHLWVGKDADFGSNRFWVMIMPPVRILYLLSRQGTIKLKTSAGLLLLP